MSVVIADTAIATGYSQPRITPAATPTLAMMNENSPIWARLNPAFIAVRRPWPARKAPIVTASTFPTMTVSVSTRTAPQCSASALGSMIIPTDTKKIAANMSRTGRTSFSISASCPDSAISEPAMKAPNATE